MDGSYGNCRNKNRVIYILTNRTARSFAPVAIQVDALFFILAMVDGADVSLRLKTRSFRSFLISHMTTYFLAGSQHVNLFLYQ
jgi:hypothetical protein